jgi:hypothetical protein
MTPVKQQKLFSPYMPLYQVRWARINASFNVNHDYIDALTSELSLFELRSLYIGQRRRA